MFLVKPLAEKDRCDTMRASSLLRRTAFLIIEELELVRRVSERLIRRLAGENVGVYDDGNEHV